VFAGVHRCLWVACTLLALFAVYHLKKRETTGYAVNLLSMCSHSQDVDVLLAALLCFQFWFRRGDSTQQVFQVLPMCLGVFLLLVVVHQACWCMLGVFGCCYMLSYGYACCRVTTWSCFRVATWMDRFQDAFYKKLLLGRSSPVPQPLCCGCVRFLKPSGSVQCVDHLL
jgi:hypothetical protein